MGFFSDLLHPEIDRHVGDLVSDLAFLTGPIAPLTRLCSAARGQLSAHSSI